ncbi:MAG: FapA family protein, partial [Oscillospiraceae bacterium]
MDKTIDEQMNALLTEIEGRPLDVKTQEEPAVAQEEETVKELPPPEIKIELTRDKMTAFLNAKVYGPQQEITVEDIVAKLGEKGIVYGINHELLREFCEKRQFFKSIRAASGLQPTKGDDGKLTFYFRRELSNAPVELEDGTLDFKNLNNIENVSKDDLLCTLVPPGEGTDGMDVCGNPVAAVSGKNVNLPSGKNVIVSDDGLSLYAMVDGSITYRGSVITIDDCKIIKNDVGPETGNIDYSGSVVINGGVMEGFSVKASKDITVKGNVEGAKLVAGGNILLASGINGMNKGLVKAEGDITSKYTENVTIDCGGTFRTDVSMNCTVWAKGAIIVKGKNGAILSGNYIANDFIYVKTVGSINRNNTSLMVQNMWYLKTGKGEE